MFYPLVAIIYSQAAKFAPLSHMRVSGSLSIAAGRDHWKFETMGQKAKFEDEDGMDHYEVIRKNGRIEERFQPGQSPFVVAVRVRINPGYPVVAVRGAYGLGAHWDTVFFAIRTGKLIKMGRPPAMNSNGPVLWHGRRNVWEFDNLDRYMAMDHELKSAYVLMRVDRSGKLRLWKTLPARHPHVRKTVQTPTIELCLRQAKAAR